MMKYLKLLVFLFIIIVISYSCKHDCYRDLNKEEIRRIGYTGGETLIFKSNQGLFDTATVSELAQQSWELEKKCKNKRHSYKVAAAFNHKLYDSTILGLPLFVYIYTPDAKSKDFVYPEVSFYGGYTFDESQKGTQIVNGQQYDNVYELTNQVPSFKCEKIYFSFERGLLKVVNKDGTYWERINL